MSYKSLLKSAAKACLPKRFLVYHQLRRELEQGEPELWIAPCICNQQEIAIDVGANQGIYAYAFSKYSHHVIAVEPNPRLVNHLKKALPSSTEILNIAASNQDGESEFYIPELNKMDIDSRGSLDGDANKGLPVHLISVLRRRLDEIPLGGIGVAAVKIDVEGHELNALEGLSGVIQQSRPTIIVESESRHHEESPYSVFDFLRTHGYQGYFIHKKRLHPLEMFSVEVFQNEGNAKSVFDGRSPDYINNFIFVHSSRSGVLEEMKKVFPL